MHGQNFLPLVTLECQNLHLLGSLEGQGFECFVSPGTDNQQEKCESLVSPLMPLGLNKVPYVFSVQCRMASPPVWLKLVNFATT